MKIGFSLIKKIVLTCLSLFVLLLFCIWFYVTQPAFITKTDHRVLVSPLSLKKHVYMLSETLAPRDYLHPNNIRRVADYIKHEFEKTNAKVRMQDNPGSSEIIRQIRVSRNWARQLNQTARNSSEPIAQKNLDSINPRHQYYQNVIAEFGPDTKYRIVIGAHYDAVSGSPGADDNATGVAGLIEIAKLLSTAKLSMKVELVAYCLEETPFFRTPKMGSSVHAATLKKNKQKIKVMISLEMLGYYDGKSNSQSYPISFLKYFYSDRGDFISVIGKFGQASIARQIKKLVSANTSIPVYSITAPTFLEGVDFSDHGNYWSNDYQAVMITDTAFFRNKHYHQQTDTYDTIDYQRMSSVVAAIFLAVKQLANSN